MGESYNGPPMSGNPLDLRTWLATIDQLGELKTVEGADWNLELGAISELNVKKSLPPALLFDRIKDYPKGFRVLTCSTSSPARLSSILRLPVRWQPPLLLQSLATRTFAPASSRWMRGAVDLSQQKK